MKKGEEKSLLLPISPALQRGSFLLTAFCLKFKLLTTDEDLERLFLPHFLSVYLSCVLIFPSLFPLLFAQPSFAYPPPSLPLSSHQAYSPLSLENNLFPFTHYNSVNILNVIVPFFLPRSLHHAPFCKLLGSPRNVTAKLQ